MADQGQAAARPAGWRKDPSGRHYGRWWDGQQWTENVISAEKVQSIDPLPPRPEPFLFPDNPPAPATPVQVAAPDSAERRQAAYLILGGAGAVGVGCFLPWAKVTGALDRHHLEGGRGLCRVLARIAAHGIRRQMPPESALRPGSRTAPTIRKADLVAPACLAAAGDRRLAHGAEGGR